MPILEIDEFKKNRELKKPILALDLGEKFIGVAISDINWIIGSPLRSIANGKFTPTASMIFDIVDEVKASGLIIGLPKNMDKTEGTKAQSHRQFARNLLKIKEIDICFHDERASTQNAESILLQTNMNYTKRKTLIDKMAASVFLQDFIDSLKL